MGPDRVHSGRPRHLLPQKQPWPVRKLPPIRARVWLMLLEQPPMHIGDSARTPDSSPVLPAEGAAPRSARVRSFLVWSKNQRDSSGGSRNEPRVRSERQLLPPFIFSHPMDHSGLMQCNGGPVERLEISSGSNKLFERSDGELVLPEHRLGKGEASLGRGVLWVAFNQFRV